MREFHRKVDTKGIKAVQEKKPATIAGNPTVIFDKSKHKENEEKKVLKQAEIYFRGTSTASALNLLTETERPNLGMVLSEMRGEGARVIERFLRVGVIEKAGREILIHPEKLGDLYKETKGAKILFLREKNPEMTNREIADALEVSFSSVVNEITKLKKKGLLGRKIKEKGSVNSSNNITTQQAETGKKKLSPYEAHQRFLALDEKILKLVEEMTDIRMPLEQINEILEDDATARVIKKRIYLLYKNRLLDIVKIYKGKKIKLFVKKYIKKEVGQGGL